MSMAAAKDSSQVQRNKAADEEVERKLLKDLPIQYLTQAALGGRI